MARHSAKHSKDNQATLKKQSVDDALFDDVVEENIDFDEDDFEDDVVVPVISVEDAPVIQMPETKKKKKKKDKAEIPAYMRKSRRIRRILIVVIILLILLLGVGGYLAYQLYQTVEKTATQQAQIISEDIAVTNVGDTAHESSTATKKTTVPNLIELLGLTEEAAIEKLQHGAQVSFTRDIKEVDNPIMRESRVALTAEPADSRTGTPTVYLAFDYTNKVVQAGYSTTTSSLGYGSFSFADAVRNIRIINQTLAEAGLNIPDDSVKLPENKMEYSTYASDGTTLTKEYCSFSGDVKQNNKNYTWSAVLSYDYAMANASGNLADTMRTIYVYVGR